MAKNTVSIQTPPLPQPKLWPNPQMVFAPLITANEMLTLTGDTGGPIPPNVAGNIDVLGDSAQGVHVNGTIATNSLMITIDDTTTTQKGVVLLATNLEAIAGSDTTKALTADDLKAKLGTQTLHGLPIGESTSGAFNWTAAPTNGQLLIGSTGNDPVLGNLTSSDSSITITNGSGTIDLKAAISITSPLTIVQGGTGVNAFANTDGVIYYDGTTLNSTAVGTSDFVLMSNGTGFAPSFKAIPAMTSPLPIIQGGTNATSMANTDGVAYYDGTRLVTTAVGTSSYVLMSNGTGFAPTFQAIPSISSPVTIAQGGTNATSMTTTDGVVYYDGTSLVTTDAGTATYVLTSNGPGVAPTYQPAGSTGMAWVTVVGTSQALSANTGYIANNAGLVTFTLPMTSSVGDTIIIEGLGAGGWTIDCNGNTLRFGNQSTTGSLSSTNQYDTVTMNCVVANTTWTVRASVGNLSLVAPLVMQMTFSGSAAGNIGSMLFLKTDGSCWGCGFNTNGVLGNLTATSYSSPIAAVGGHAFVSISGGSNDAIALKSNGSAWGWGTNTSGQLGDLTTTDRSSPVAVVGNHSFIKVLGYNDGAAGTTIGLKSDGSAWTWGSGGSGALGNLSISNQSSPISVVGNHSFIYINGANTRGMALKSDGSAWMWGGNINGALGNQSTTDTSSPVAVVGNHSFIKICGGILFTMALKSDGTCWGWGDNSVGQLGTLSATNTSSPVAVVGSHSFIDLTTSAASCYGLKSDGSIWSWGINTSGVLGDQSATNRSSPVSVVGGFSFSKLMNNSGYFDAGGILANGTVLTWGINNYGQLGNNTRTSYSSPIVVVGLP